MMTTICLMYALEFKGVTGGAVLGITLGSVIGVDDEPPPPAHEESISAVVVAIPRVSNPRLVRIIVQRL